MKEADMRQVAQFIDDAIAHHDDDAYLAREAKEVETFLQAFPLYPQLG